MYASHAQLQDLIKKWNAFAGGLRGEHQRFASKASEQLAQLSNIAQALHVKRGPQSDCISWERNGVVRVEDIPGRRVPYDVVLNIPIVNASTSDVEQSWVVPQEGPFVATKRWATFLSNHQYRVMLGQLNVGNFLGRTNGRYRPVHSAWDLYDGQQGLPIINNPPLAGAFPGAMAVTSSASGGRSMSFDGRILMFNAGSSYPRMNEAVPSSIWTTQINSPYELGALDFFERGEALTFKVTPNHVNNPPYGNADGPSIFAAGGALGAAGFPFVAGQFDPHEGIVTPQGFVVTSLDGATTITRAPTDGITRLPDGILIVGLSGYRIIQPVGPVS